MPLYLQKSFQHPLIPDTAAVQLVIDHAFSD